MVKGTVFFLVDIDHPTLFYLVDSRGPSMSILQPFSSRPICMIKNTNVMNTDFTAFVCAIQIERCEKQDHSSRIYSYFCTFNLCYSGWLMWVNLTALGVFNSYYFILSTSDLVFKVYTMPHKHQIYGKWIFSYLAISITS